VGPLGFAVLFMVGFSVFGGLRGKSEFLIFHIGIFSG